MHYNILRIYGPTASIFANLTTVISIIAGVVFLHEVFTPFQIVGAVIILISVFFANRQQGASLE